MTHAQRRECGVLPEGVGENEACLGAHKAAVQASRQQRAKAMWRLYVGEAAVEVVLRRDFNSLPRILRR